MKILYELRPEIFSLFITGFMILYSTYCNKFRASENDFLSVAFMCLGHCIMALVTEITVNSPGVPAFLNDICHVLFFAFSLLYSLFYLRYALKQILPGEKARKNIMIAATIVTELCIIVMLLSPIEYLHGEYTDYSAGTGPTLCYTLGFVYLIVADIIFLINRKKINEEIVLWLLPLSGISLGILAVQILIPQYLATAQSLTLTTLGLFFVIENPIEKFRNRSFIDDLTHSFSRNCYDYDISTGLKGKLDSGNLIYCMADINGLKSVNDNLGHLDGDVFISKAAEILHNELKSAYKIYRIGGDEFAALYFDTDPAVVAAETSAAAAACEKIELSRPFPAGISIGCAEKVAGETLEDTEKRAEIEMYKKKKEYYETRGIDRRKL